MIRPSTSPWCSSSVTVGKKDGSLRLCQDYRPLNAIIVPDPYVLKRIDDTLDHDCLLVCEMRLLISRSAWMLF